MSQLAETGVAGSALYRRSRLLTVGLLCSQSPCRPGPESRMHKRPPVSLLVLVAALAVRAVADAPQPLRLRGRRVGRALAQAAPSGQTLKYAPCNAAAELTCSGVPSTKAICCNKMNFVCGTRNDTGGPRCVVCPQICSSACGAGYACDRDPADGCFKCLPATCSPGCGAGSSCQKVASRWQCAKLAA
ncbi:hypothetical protein ABPG77_006748 [Micractinium sp. CCAP 211/92]